MSRTRQRRRRTNCDCCTGGFSIKQYCVSPVLRFPAIRAKHRHGCKAHRLCPRFRRFKIPVHANIPKGRQSPTLIIPGTKEDHKSGYLRRFLRSCAGTPTHTPAIQHGHAAGQTRRTTVACSLALAARRSHPDQANDTSIACLRCRVPRRPAGRCRPPSGYPTGTRIHRNTSASAGRKRGGTSRRPRA